MTTAYTSLLGLALPVTGELSGTWGDTVNNYITSYIDEAVEGTQTISGNQTAVTLSVTTNAALSQVGSNATGSAQYAVINCTGNPASLLTVTAPASSRQYIVINATSTSQSVQIVGVGPTTGVTIVSGEKAIVAWNGSDFVKVASTVVPASSITGTLPVANGGTGVTTSTGSGSVVLSNSPALTTPNLGTPSAATLTNATGLPLTTGVTGTLPIGNGGTGVTTTPANGQLLIGDGTGYTVANLTAGTGCTINNTAGGITINATGTGGSVTSVGMTVPAFLSVSGSPVTTTGTLAVSYSGTALPVANGGTGQTTYTNGQLLIGNTTGNTLTKATLTAGSGISITNGTGSITIAATGGSGTVTSVAFSGGTTGLTVTGSPITTSGTITLAGTLAVANGGTGATTASAAATALGLGTGSNVQHSSLGIGTAASGTAGEIRATNNVTAFYSSDRKFKENVKDIENPVAKVKAIGGKTFDWTDEYIADHGGEDDYFIQKQDFGVIAQDVESVFPMAVKKRPDGSLAVDYQKLSALALAAIAELTARIEALEAKQ